MINTSHGKSVGKYHMVIRVKETITTSGPLQLESSYQLFGKGGDISFAFLRRHRL